MKLFTEKRDGTYKPHKWLLFAIVFVIGVFNLSGLTSFLLMDDSRRWAQMFHAGWLLSVWSYSLLLYLLIQRYDASLIPAKSSQLIMIGGAVGAVSVSIGLPLLGYITSIRPSSHEIIYNRLSQLFFALMLLVALNGVYYAERLYRSFHHGFRFRMTLLTLIGTLCFSMLLGSLALMYHYLNIYALMVALVPSLVADVLLAYHVLREGGSSQLQISRSTLYRSSTLLVSGIFLLLLGFMGEIIRLIGTHLNFFLAFLTAFLVLLISLMVILFDSIKNRVQRFIVRNFYKGFYDYRVEWERANRRILPVHDAKLLQRVVLAAVAEPIGAEQSCLLMLDPTNQLFVAASNGFQIQAKQISAVFLDWVWRYGKPIQIEKVSLTAEVLSPLVESGVHLVAPVIFERQLLALILLSSMGRTYTQEDIEFLETIGGHISLALANQKYRESLIEAEELKNFNRLSAFVLHDLKNAASMLSMILQNAQDNLDNPEFRADMFRTIESVAERIQKLIRRLSAPLEQESLEFCPTDLKKLIQEVVKMAGVSQIPRIQYREKLEPVPPVSVAPLEIQKVIHNLLINAVEAIEDEGEIQIHLSQCASGVCIEVSDTGCGISQDFIQNSLFKPFNTTKSKGLGIGLYHCKTIVEMHGGRIDVESTLGEGSRFRIILPLKPADARATQNSRQT